MRKFNEVYKKKQQITNKLQEQQILTNFKQVYSTLLEQYNTTDINKLDNKSKNAFITELNEYWTESDGLTKKGKRFLKNNKSILTENSTVIQKKKYLSEKAESIIDETLRTTNLKYKLYDILDEMYKETKSTDINDVLKDKLITKVIAESFKKSVGKLISEINYEISDDINE